MLPDGFWDIRASQRSAVIYLLADTLLKHAMSSWFGGDSSQAQAYDTWQNSDVTQHQPDTVHELIAGAASYEVSEDLLFFFQTLLTRLCYQAAKAYEDHVAANGQPPSHAKAKEILCAVTQVMCG